METEQLIDGIETYTPSGRFKLTGIAIMLILGGLPGIATAFAIHLILDITGFYIMFLFPAGIGLAAGFGLLLGIEKGQCRNTFIGIIAGLIIGIIIYISMHFFNSLSYSNSGLVSYLGEMVEEGYSFFSDSSSIGVWIEWAIELAVVLFFTITIGAWASHKAYCEQCNQWCENKTLFISSNESIDDITTALYNKEFHRFKDLKNENFNDRDKSVIELSYCKNCLNTGYITLKSVTPKGDKEKTHENTIISDATIGDGSLNILFNDFPAEC